MQWHNKNVSWEVKDMICISLSPSSLPITRMSLAIQVKGIYEESNAALRREKADKIFYMATDLNEIDNPNFYHEELYSIEDELFNGDHTPVFNNFSLKASILH